MANWQQKYNDYQNGPNAGSLFSSLIIEASFILGDEANNIPPLRTDVPEAWKTQAREVMNSYNRAQQYFAEVVHNQLPFDEEIEIEGFTFKAQIYAGRYLIDVKRTHNEYMFITLGVNDPTGGDYTAIRESETNDGYFLKGTNGTEEDCREAASILHRYLGGRTNEELVEP